MHYQKSTKWAVWKPASAVLFHNWIKSDCYWLPQPLDINWLIYQLVNLACIILMKATVYWFKTELHKSVQQLKIDKLLSPDNLHNHIFISTSLLLSMQCSWTIFSRMVSIILSQIRTIATYGYSIIFKLNLETTWEKVLDMSLHLHLTTVSHSHLYCSTLWTNFATCNQKLNNSLGYCKAIAKPYTWNNKVMARVFIKTWNYFIIKQRRLVMHFVISKDLLIF